MDEERFQALVGARPEPPAKNKASGEDYDRMADTVGLVPNLRASDNKTQGLVVLGGMLIGGVVGAALGGGYGMLLGALAGIILFGFVSGLVLMVVGWRRASRKNPHKSQ